MECQAVNDYGMKCKKTGHETTFGQHREGNELFYKTNMEWRTYDEIKSDGEKKSEA